MLKLDDTPNKSNLGANAILGVSLAVAKAASNALGMELYNYIGELEGRNVFEQRLIDEKMLKLDDTPNKSNLGANAILGVSLAVAKAASNALGMELYNYIGGINATELPVPMMNILNGGKHSDNNISIQEFMIMPIGKITFEERLKRGVEIYHTLKKVLKEKGHSVAVGDEGGFAPNFKNEEEALDIIVEAIKKAGYEPKKDIVLALDIASTEMFDEAKKIGKDGYYFWKTEVLKTKTEMIQYLVDLCEKYPIASIEDGLAEEDWESWKELTEKIGDKVQLVGDDLFVTNRTRLRRGIEKNIANAILIKPTQIGTLTETLDTIKLAEQNNYRTIISHRSGETEDTTIADIAVAINSMQIKTGAPCRTDRVAHRSGETEDTTIADIAVAINSMQIKTGAPCRTDRVAKYNRLLRIEKELT